MLFETNTVPLDVTNRPSGSLTLLFSDPFPFPPATVLAFPFPGKFKVKSLSISAVPDRANSISASREALPERVTMIFVLSLSAILADANDKEVEGLLMLSNCNTIRLFAAVAFSIDATFKTISSIGSTVVSLSVAVEIVIVPEVWPVGITIELELNTNSEVNEAVEPTVLKVIVIVEPEAFDALAVKITSLDEFSVILGLLSVNDIDGTSPIFLMVKVDVVDVLIEAFTAEDKLTIAVSSFSEMASRKPLKLIDPVNDPAGILTCGFN